MSKLNNLQADTGMPADDPFGLGAWNTMFLTAQTWSRQVAATGAACHREWATFIERRLKQDLALTDRLMNSKGLDDLSRHYSDFFRTALEDYQRQFATLSRLGAEAARPMTDAITEPLPRNDDGAARGPAIVTH